MALTLPSSNGNLLFFNNNDNNNNLSSDNGQINSHFNGSLTKTTATLTPTRLKNIEEQFLEQSSLLPPKPFLHDHMAGFVPPTVNIKLHVKQQNNPNIINLDLINSTNEHDILTNWKSIDYFSSNSNSNDSYTNSYISDGYSSETNSSNPGATGRKNYSFSNFTKNSNSSVGSSIKMQNNKPRTRSKSVGTSNSICSAAKSTRSSQQNKSTSGGRKPNSAQHLTPEEDLKRQKRRERNKLAAARCRKKRVDQTNYLIEQTRELQRKHEALIKETKSRLKEFQSFKDTLAVHEAHCCNLKIHVLPEICSQIDFTAINSAMEPVLDDDMDSDLNAACYASSSQEEFPPQASPPKRKRPNSLLFRPIASQIKAEQQQQQHDGSSSLTIIQQTPGVNNNSELSTNNLLATPSNGLQFSDFGLEHTGLTPLNPTYTSVDLTPSTMSALLRSLTSPIEDGERKKLISM